MGMMINQLFAGQKDSMQQSQAPLHDIYSSSGQMIKQFSSFNAVTSLTQFNAIFVTPKGRALR